MNKYILLFLWLFSATLFGQDQISGKWAEYVDPNPKIPLSNYSKTSTIHVLVKFSRSMSTSALAKENIRILRVLDQEHAILLLPANRYVDFNTEHLVLPLNNRWKLSDVLLNASSSKKEKFVIKSDDVEKTMSVIKTFKKLKFLERKRNYVYVYGKLATIKEKLLPLNEVHYIGKESFEPVQESTVGDLNPAINTINTIYKEYPNINGEGITVSVKDNAFIATDIDLKNKLVPSPLISNTTDMHATDMSTIISGLGNSSIKGRGVAPKAKIQSSDFSNIDPDPKIHLSEANIFTQNHSYGTVVETFYGSIAESYDTHIHENPFELHIFTSGNVGGTIPENGTYSGLGDYANLTGNFKMAKNSLIIGAADEENNISSFSSKGPAHDGRIKPELVAYSIIGTSNANALTSGVAALLQQTYIERNGTNALASLLKAVLINSADEIGPLGPDFSSGYGSVNGYKAVKTIQEDRFMVDSIASDENKPFLIDIPENVKNLKVTLVWTDIPGQVNTNRALVNDIDLTVSQNGTEYSPWVLNEAPTIESLQSPAQRGEDHLNNIEQVLIENPIAGQATIQINGFDISTEEQEFSIAYGWEEKDVFKWNYPLADDNFPYDGETASYFRWNSSFEAANGDLSISYDNGTTWQNISSGLSLSDGYYLWTAPENMNTTAILRMTIDGVDFVSDSFVISNAINLKVGLDCEDTVQLIWNRQEGTQEYNVYTLSGESLERIATVTDTTYVFNKNSIDSNYFSVQPILNNGSEGVIGATIDYQVLNAGCYESFLIAEISEDQKAGRLSLSLSSLLNVSTIEIERKIGTVYETIGTVPELDKLNSVFLDEQPEQGLNTYRIKITTANDGVFFSEEAELFFLTTVAFATFPNPVDDGITVFTKDFSEDIVWLEIYSLDGRFILSQEITLDQQFVFLNSLNQGLYALTIYATQGGERLAKLIYKL